MSFERRIIVGNRERLCVALDSFKAALVSPEHPLEVIVRTLRREKTHDQRKLWHAVMADLAPELGLTPGQTKELVKQEFYGIEVKTVFGRRHEFVQGSEDSDRAEYSRLIDFTYQLAAENGVAINDRRTA